MVNIARIWGEGLKKTICNMTKPGAERDRYPADDCAGLDVDEDLGDIELEYCWPKL